MYWYPWWFYYYQPPQYAQCTYSPCSDYCYWAHWARTQASHWQWIHQDAATAFRNFATMMDQERLKVCRDPIGYDFATNRTLYGYCQCP